MEKQLKGIAYCSGELAGVLAGVMVIDGTVFLGSQLESAFLEDRYRPRRMHASTDLLTIEGCLAEVMEQRGDYQTLTWKVQYVGSEHRIKNLKAVHHQSMVSAMMTMTLRCSHVVTSLDEIDDRVYSRTVDL